MEYYENSKSIAEQIMEAIGKARSEMKTLNVMVLGKTGAGKSTLINNMFNESLAATGTGKPVTQSVTMYSKEGFPLHIYDTPGLELNGENAMNELISEVDKLMGKGIASGKIENAIHCIWYCVSTPSHRFEKAEADFITRFISRTRKYDVPVIIVLTQAFSKKDARELKGEIEKENLNVAQIVPVLASDYEIDDDYTVHSYGLDILSEVMNSVIPESLKNTFASVQKASLKLKVQRSHGVVASSTAAAAGTCFIPVPVADSVMLVPEQVAMLAGITAVFGLPVEKSTLTAIVSATIGTMGATVAGKTIASGILKCIPGYGTIAGGAISAGVAGALTAALGEAYIGVMTLVASGEMKLTDIETEKGKAVITQMFKDRLKLKRNKKCEVIEEEDHMVIA